MRLPLPLPAGHALVARWGGGGRARISACTPRHLLAARAGIPGDKTLPEGDCVDLVGRIPRSIPKLEEKMSEDAFEPEIVGFCCHYCAYAAADLAGSMRLSYPANVKIIELPCSGRIDVLHILRALERGADAVFVAG